MRYYYDSHLAARLFDLQHEGDPVLEAETRFFLARIREQNCSALDLGCGTGRILLPAMREGLDIAGFDGSHAFLDRLRRKAAEQNLHTPRVWRADLDQPALPPDSTDLAFAAFRTVDHLALPGEVEGFLRGMLEIVRPGGMFIFNTANALPEDFEATHGLRILMRDDIEDPETGLGVMWWGTTRFDPEDVLIHQTAEYEMIDETGRVCEQWRFAFTLRWLPIGAMREMLDEAGWKIEAAYGGFEGEPLEPGSGDAVWVLRRP